MKSMRLIRIISIGLAVCFTAHDVLAFAPQRPLVLPAPVMPRVRFALPDSVALIDDGFAPEGDKDRSPRVILFQDAHTNASGQFNLAKALENVIRSEGIGRIYVEGGWGDCSLSELKRSADPARLDDAAARYVRKGILHGEEYLSLTSDLDFQILGVEEKSLYDQGLQAYAEETKTRAEGLRYLDRIRRGLRDQEKFVFDPELARFEAVREKYHKGGLALTDWFGTLMVQAKKNGVYLGDYTNLRQMRRLVSAEKSIDFHRVESEEREALDRLDPASRSDLQGLVGKDPSRITGSQDAARSYYFLLEEKLHGELSRYPALVRYIRYLRGSRRLSAPAVLDELESLESQVLDRLARTPHQKLLVSLKDTSTLIERLLQLQITPKEYERLSSRQALSDAKTLSGFVNARIMDREAGYEGAIALEQSLTSAEAAAKHFYDLASARDQVFLSAIQKRLDENSAEPIVLITGGFHTSALKDRLRSQGISFVSILPQVREETDQTRYERLLLAQLKSSEFDTRTAVSDHRDTAQTLRTLLLALNPGARMAFEADVSANPSREASSASVLANATSGRIAVEDIKDRLHDLQQSANQLQRMYRVPEEQVLGVWIVVDDKGTTRQAVSSDIVELRDRHGLYGILVKMGTLWNQLNEMGVQELSEGLLSVALDPGERKPWREYLRDFIRQEDDSLLVVKRIAAGDFKKYADTLRRFGGPENPVPYQSLAAYYSTHVFPSDNPQKLIDFNEAVSRFEADWQAFKARLEGVIDLDDDQIQAMIESVPGWKAARAEPAAGARMAAGTRRSFLRNAAALAGLFPATASRAQDDVLALDPSRTIYDLDFDQVVPAGRELREAQVRILSDPGTEQVVAPIWDGECNILLVHSRKKPGMVAIAHLANGSDVKDRVLKTVSRLTAGEAEDQYESLMDHLGTRGIERGDAVFQLIRYGPSHEENLVEGQPFDQFWADLLSKKSGSPVLQKEVLRIPHMAGDKPAGRHNMMRRMWSDLMLGHNGRIEIRSYADATVLDEQKNEVWIADSEPVFRAAVTPDGFTELPLISLQDEIRNFLAAAAALGGLAAIIGYAVGLPLRLSRSGTPINPRSLGRLLASDRTRLMRLFSDSNSSGARMADRSNDEIDADMRDKGFPELARHWEHFKTLGVALNDLDDESISRLRDLHMGAFISNRLMSLLYITAFAWLGIAYYELFVDEGIEHPILRLLLKSLSMVNANILLGQSILWIVRTRIRPMEKVMAMDVAWMLKQRNYRAAFDSTGPAKNVMDRLRGMGIGPAWDDSDYVVAYRADAKGKVVRYVAESNSDATRRILKDLIGSLKDRNYSPGRLFSSLLQGKNSVTQIVKLHGQQIRSHQSTDWTDETAKAILVEMRDRWVKPGSVGYQELDRLIRRIDGNSAEEGVITAEIWKRDPWSDLTHQEEFYSSASLRGVKPLGRGTKGRLGTFGYLRNKSISALDIRVGGKRKVRVRMAAAVRISENGDETPLLYVDGAEGSNAVKPAVIRTAIEDYARACGFSFVFYNARPLNKIPRRFADFLAAEGMAETALRIKYLDASHREYLDGFGAPLQPFEYAFPEGAVIGYASSVDPASAVIFPPPSLVQRVNRWIGSNILNLVVASALIYSTVVIGCTDPRYLIPLGVVTAAVLTLHIRLQNRSLSDRSVADQAEPRSGARMAFWKMFLSVLVLFGGRLPHLSAQGPVLPSKGGRPERPSAAQGDPLWSRLIQRALDLNPSAIRDDRSLDAKEAELMQVAVRAVLQTIPQFDPGSSGDWKKWIHDEKRVEYFGAWVTYLLVSAYAESYSWDGAHPEGLELYRLPDERGLVELLLSRMPDPGAAQWWRILAPDIERALGQETLLSGDAGSDERARALAGFLEQRIRSEEKANRNKPLYVPGLPEDWQVRLAADRLLAAKLHVLRFAAIGGKTTSFLASDPALAAGLAARSLSVALYLHENPVRTVDSTTLFGGPSGLTADAGVAAWRRFDIISRDLVGRALAGSLNQPLVIPPANDALETEFGRTSQALVATFSQMELLQRALEVGRYRAGRPPEDLRAIDRIILSTRERLKKDRHALQIAVDRLKDKAADAGSWNPLGDDIGRLLRATQGTMDNAKALIKEDPSGARMADAPDQAAKKAAFAKATGNWIRTLVFPNAAVDQMPVGKATEGLMAWAKHDGDKAFATAYPQTRAFLISAAIQDFVRTNLEIIREEGAAQQLRNRGLADYADALEKAKALTSPAPREWRQLSHLLERVPGFRNQVLSEYPWKGWDKVGSWAAWASKNTETVLAEFVILRTVLDQVTYENYHDFNWSEAEVKARTATVKASVPAAVVTTSAEPTDAAAVVAEPNAAESSAAEPVDPAATTPVDAPGTPAAPSAVEPPAQTSPSVPAAPETIATPVQTADTDEAAKLLIWISLNLKQAAARALADLLKSGGNPEQLTPIYQALIKAGAIPADGAGWESELKGIEDLAIKKGQFAAALLRLARVRELEPIHREFIDKEGGLASGIIKIDKDLADKAGPDRRPINLNSTRSDDAAKKEAHRLVSEQFASTDPDDPKWPDFEVTVAGNGLGRVTLRLPASGRQAARKLVFEMGASDTWPDSFEAVLKRAYSPRLGYFEFTLSPPEKSDFRFEPRIYRIRRDGRMLPVSNEEGAYALERVMPENLARAAWEAGYIGLTEHLSRLGGGVPEDGLTDFEAVAKTTDGGHITAKGSNTPQVQFSLKLRAGQTAVVSRSSQPLPGWEGRREWIYAVLPLKDDATPDGEPRLFRLEKDPEAVRVYAAPVDLNGFDDVALNRMLMDHVLASDPWSPGIRPIDGFVISVGKDGRKDFSKNRQKGSDQPAVRVIFDGLKKETRYVVRSYYEKGQSEWVFALTPLKLTGSDAVEAAPTFFRFRRDGEQAVVNQATGWPSSKFPKKVDLSNALIRFVPSGARMAQTPIEKVKLFIEALGSAGKGLEPDERMAPVAEVIIANMVSVGMDGTWYAAPPRWTDGWLQMPADEERTRGQVLADWYVRSKNSPVVFFRLLLQQPGALFGPSFVPGGSLDVHQSGLTLQELVSVLKQSKILAQSDPRLVPVDSLQKAAAVILSAFTREDVRPGLERDMQAVLGLRDLAFACGPYTIHEALDFTLPTYPAQVFKDARSSVDLAAPSTVAAISARVKAAVAASDTVLLNHWLWLLDFSAQRLSPTAKAHALALFAGKSDEMIGKVIQLNGGEVPGFRDWFFSSFDERSRPRVKAWDNTEILGSMNRLREELGDGPYQRLAKTWGLVAVSRWAMMSRLDRLMPELRWLADSENRDEDAHRKARSLHGALSRIEKLTFDAQEPDHTEHLLRLLSTCGIDADLLFKTVLYAVFPDQEDFASSEYEFVSKTRLLDRPRLRTLLLSPETKKEFIFFLTAVARLGYLDLAVGGEAENTVANLLHQNSNGIYRPVRRLAESLPHPTGGLKTLRDDVKQLDDRYPEKPRTIFYYLRKRIHIQPGAEDDLLAAAVMDALDVYTRHESMDALRDQAEAILKPHYKGGHDYMLALEQSLDSLPKFSGIAAAVRAFVPSDWQGTASEYFIRGITESRRKELRSLSSGSKDESSALLLVNIVIEAATYYGRYEGREDRIDGEDSWIESYFAVQKGLNDRRENQRALKTTSPKQSVGPLPGLTYMHGHDPATEEYSMGVMAPDIKYEEKKMNVFEGDRRECDAITGQLDRLISGGLKMLDGELHPKEAADLVLMSDFDDRMPASASISHREPNLDRVRKALEPIVWALEGYATQLELDEVIGDRSLRVIRAIASRVPHPTAGFDGQARRLPLTIGGLKSYIALLRDQMQQFDAQLVAEYGSYPAQIAYSLGPLRVREKYRGHDVMGLKRSFWSKRVEASVLNDLLGEKRALLAFRSGLQRLLDLLNSMPQKMNEELITADMESVSHAELFRLLTASQVMGSAQVPLDETGAKGYELSVLESHGFDVPAFVTLNPAGAQANADRVRRFVMDAILEIEKKSRKIFPFQEDELEPDERAHLSAKRAENRINESMPPLFLSVRSGSVHSMPGVMETVVDLPYHPASLTRLTASSPLENWFYADTARMFFTSWGSAINGVDPVEFSGTIDRIKLKIAFDRMDWRRRWTKRCLDWIDRYFPFITRDILTITQVSAIKGWSEPDLHATLIDQFSQAEMDQVLKAVRERSRFDRTAGLERRPFEQVCTAVRAVYASWNSVPAASYRKKFGISDQFGTAVTLQEMAFGNSSKYSGTAVVFSWDTKTEGRKPHGLAKFRSQGTNIVSGVTRSSMDISRVNGEGNSIEEKYPNLYAVICEMVRKVDALNVGAPSDLEITWDVRDDWPSDHPALAKEVTESGMACWRGALKLLQTRGLGMRSSKDLRVLNAEYEDEAQQGRPVLRPNFSVLYTWPGRGSSPGAAYGVPVKADDLSVEELQARIRSVRQSTASKYHVPPEQMGVILIFDLFGDQQAPKTYLDGVVGLVSAGIGEVNHGSLIANKQGIPYVAAFEEGSLIPDQKAEDWIMAIDGKTGWVFLHHINENEPMPVFLKPLEENVGGQGQAVKRKSSKPGSARTPSSSTSRHATPASPATGRSSAIPNEVDLNYDPALDLLTPNRPIDEIVIMDDTAASLEYALKVLRKELDARGIRADIRVFGRAGEVDAYLREPRLFGALVLMDYDVDSDQNGASFIRDWRKAAVTDPMFVLSAKKPFEREQLLTAVGASGTAQAHREDPRWPGWVADVITKSRQGARMAGSNDILGFLSSVHPTISPERFAEAYKTFAGSVHYGRNFSNIWGWMSLIRPIPGYEDVVSGMDLAEAVRRVGGSESDPSHLFYDGTEMIAVVMAAAADPSLVTPEVFVELEKTFSKHFAWAASVAGMLLQLRPDLANEKTLSTMINAYSQIRMQDPDSVRGSTERLLIKNHNTEIWTSMGRSIERFLEADRTLALTPALRSFALKRDGGYGKASAIYLDADESSMESTYKSDWHLGAMDKLVGIFSTAGILVTPVEIEIDPETYYHSESHYTTFRSLFFLKTEKRYEQVVAEAVRRQVWSKPVDQQAQIMGEILANVAAQADAPEDLADRMRLAGIQEAPDPAFAGIYREAIILNPDLDLAALYRLYREYWPLVFDWRPLQPDVEKAGLAKLVVMDRDTRLDTPNDDKNWLNGREEGVSDIQDDPLLLIVHERLGIREAQMTLRLSIEDHDSTRHYMTGVERKLLYVPARYADLLKLMIAAGEAEFMNAVMGDHDDIESRVRRGTRVLGEGVWSAGMGGKEQGFMVLKRAGLAFPPGIVLAPELALDLASGPMETRDEIDAFAARRLREIGVRLYPRAGSAWSQRSHTSDKVMLRSNPLESMPGVLESYGPTESIQGGVQTVVNAWESPKARNYRERAGKEHGYDQPLIIQKWVRGTNPNHWLPRRPGEPTQIYMSGAMSTRNPNTGAPGIYGRFIENALGQELMTRGASGRDLDELPGAFPAIHTELLKAAAKLEEAAGPQETEFVVEAGKLWFVQTRRIHFSPQAEIAYLNEQLAAGKITESRALPRIEELQKRIGSREVNQVFGADGIQPIAKAQASTPGAVEGRLVWDADMARKWAAEGDAVVMVAEFGQRDKALDTVFDLPNSGLITVGYGNNSSHEADLCRLSGVPSLIWLDGAEFAGPADHRVLKIGDVVLEQGDHVVIDGDGGSLYPAGSVTIQENGSISDASHGIDIPAFRKEFVSAYLNADGGVRDEFTETDLDVLNEEAQANYDALKTGTDPEAAFTANLKKHFLHDLLMQRRAQDKVAGARLTAADRPERLKIFAERAGRALGIGTGAHMTFAVLFEDGVALAETTGGLETEDRSAPTAARLADAPEAADLAAAALEGVVQDLAGLPDVPMDYELPAWDKLFPVDTALTEREIEAQAEHLLEQSRLFIKLKPRTRFFFNERLDRLSTQARSAIRSAVERSGGALELKTLVPERGRLAIRISAETVTTKGFVNLSVRPLTLGTELPVWAGIFAIPVLAAHAAVEDLAETEDPQAAFDQASGFKKTELAQKAAAFYEDGVFEGGALGVAFLSALQGKRPFLETQRPRYFLVRVGQILQSLQAMIQQTNVMA